MAASFFWSHLALCRARNPRRSLDGLRKSYADHEWLLQWSACLHRRFRRRQQSRRSFDVFPPAAQIVPLSAFLLPLVCNPTVPSASEDITSSHPVIRTMTPLPISRRPHETVARPDVLYAWWRGRQAGSDVSLCACNNWRCHRADQQAKCEPKTCAIGFHRAIPLKSRLSLCRPLVGLSGHINVFILYYFAHNRRDPANSQDILYGMVQNMGEQHSRDYDYVVLLIRRTAGGEINK